MAQCRSCGRLFDCSCQLLNGLCVHCRPYYLILKDFL
jgi:hypothetical protein